MAVLKAIKIRIYPNSNQRLVFAQTFGCTRWLWNRMLDMQIKRRENNPEANYVSVFDMNNLLTQLKNEYPWLKQVESSALQNTNESLNDAFQRFFKGQNGFPKFKKRKYAQSFTSKYNSNNIEVIDDHHLKFPKLNRQPLYYRSGRPIEGKIKRVTIRQNSAGKYYASVLVENEVKQLSKTNQSIGADLGLKALLNFSNGEKEPLKRFEELNRKLHHWQKLATRRLRGAKREMAWQEHNHYPVSPLSSFQNYQKARKMVAKYYQKITNIRIDQAQKLTTELVRQNDTIVLEKLNIKAMMKNHRLARAVANASWSRLIAILQYKCNWYGKQLIQVNPAYTSQTCINCGKTNHRLGLNKFDWLKIREWDCPHCGKHLDRDVNAAQVILKKGLATL